MFIHVADLQFYTTLLILVNTIIYTKLQRSRNSRFFEKSQLQVVKLMCSKKSFNQETASS